MATNPSAHARPERANLFDDVRTLLPRHQAAFVACDAGPVHDADGKADAPARRRQAERLAELVTRTRAPTDLVVVGGDLNLLPDSETFEVLGEIGLVDLVGKSDTRTSRYAKSVRHADYLLINRVRLSHETRTLLGHQGHSRQSFTEVHAKGKDLDFLCSRLCAARYYDRTVVCQSED